MFVDLKTVRTLLTSAVFIFFLIVTAVDAANYFVVPGNCIQTVIDSASNGDAVILLPGTHSIDSEISILKGITLTSLGTRTNTIIEGGDSNRCLYVNHSGCIVDDLTISGGFSGWNWGGGVYAVTGLIRNCMISDNNGYFGGGIFCTGSSVVSNCVIRNNKSGHGGGVGCEKESVVLNCWIENNSAIYNGGGVQCRSTILNCTIISNIAKYGGGVFLDDGRAEGCKVLSNIATNSGGGVYARDELWNCEITGNMAAERGGGIYAVSDAAIWHCTIADNFAGIEGGGIGGADDQWNRPLYISNSIIYFNTAPSFSNSFVWSDYAPCAYCCTVPLMAGTRNLSDNPFFVNADAGDYRLMRKSPCVDSCPSNAAMSVDCIGLDRVVDGDNNGFALCDMGAYECQANPAHPTYTVNVSGKSDLYSSPWPLGYGSHTIITGKIITAMAPSIDYSGNSRSICTGWSGSGSVSVRGNTNRTCFTVNQSSSLTWNWQLQHLLSFESHLGNISGAETGYWDHADELSLNCTPTNGCLFHHWKINDIYAGRGAPKSIVMTDPHHVCAVCVPDGQYTNIITFDPTPWPGISRAIDGWTEGPFSFECNKKLALRSGGGSTTPDNNTAYIIFGHMNDPACMIMSDSVHGTFSLVYADIAEYSSVYWEPVVTFLGYRQDGRVVTNTFLCDGFLDGPGGSDDFERVFFSNFNELLKIETPQGAFSLDNLKYVITSPDLDGDGMDDDWENRHFGNCTRDGMGNYDNDAYTDRQEWLAGTNPTNTEDFLTVHIRSATTNRPRMQVHWDSIENRLYTLYSADSLTSEWSNLYCTPGNGMVINYTNEGSALNRHFFHIGVKE